MHPNEGMKVSAAGAMEHPGPAGDSCHIQLPSPSAADIKRGSSPARKKTMKPGGGYEVTSPDEPMAEIGYGKHHSEPL